MSTATSSSGFAARIPRPTRSAALLLLLAAILELLGRLIKSTGVTIAAAAALGAVIGDAFLASRIDSLRVVRDLPGRLAAGVAATLRLTIEAPSGRRGARRAAVVIVEHPGLPTTRVVTPVLRAGGLAVASPQVIPPHRGYWADAGTITVEAFSPLGGFVSRRTTRLAEPVWVYPAPAPAYRLPDGLGGQPAGNAASNRAGMGTDFLGIRAWRPGDPATAVHWRASARRDQLVVMERERPTHGSLVVVCVAAVADDAWEAALARAAATAVAALRSGDGVTLLAGTRCASPRSAQAVLDFFAEISAELVVDRRALHDALKTGGSGCSMLWVSPLQIPSQIMDCARHNGVRGLSAPIASQSVTR